MSCSSCWQDVYACHVLVAVHVVCVSCMLHTNMCGSKGGGEKERKERPCPQPPPVHVLACLRVRILVLSDVFYLQVQEHTYLRVY